MQERLEDMIRDIGEGHVALLRRMDEHDRKQDLQFAEYKNFVMTMGQDLNAKIDGVRTELTERMGQLAKDLAEHRADTEEHRSRYRVSER